MFPRIEHEDIDFLIIFKILLQQPHNRRFPATPMADKSNRLPALLLLVPDKLCNRLSNALMGAERVMVRGQVV